jgi:hypothetical protein
MSIWTGLLPTPDRRGVAEAIQATLGRWLKQCALIDDRQRALDPGVPEEAERVITFWHGWLVEMRPDVRRAWQARLEETLAQRDADEERRRLLPLARVSLRDYWRDSMAGWM